MSVKTDVVNLVITVNGNEAKKKFYDLQATAAGLRAEMNGIKRGTDEWIAKSKELKSVEEQIAEVRKQVDLTDLSIGGLRKEITRLKSMRDALDPTTQAFKEMDGQVKKAEGRMRDLQQGTGFLSKSFNFLKSEIASFGVLMLGALGINYVIGKMGNLIERNAELSDSFADVRKTTGLTMQEVQELNKDFKSLNTRTARKELLDLAVEAGKLNITGKKNILEFVDTANKIKVALGKDLGENAVTELTKLTQIFKLQEKNGLSLADSLTKVGNVINQIGQNSTASEGYLVDFLSRTGPVASQADMTIQQVTALASAADQLNLSAEVAATTFNQVLPDMFTNTADYAKVAGMSTADFARILNTDANQALVVFLKGLNGNNEGLGSMAQKLKDVNIDGTRGIAVLAALAQNTGLMETALSQANTEFATGNSMLQEYNLRNQNFAANVEKIKKGISGWFQSSDMIKFFQDAFGWMSKLFDVPLSKKLEDERMRLMQIDTQLKQTNISQEKRVKLIQELQDKYPKYFANLDKDTASNNELANAIRLVNNELINRIVIQKQQEKIDEVNDEIAGKKLKAFDKEKELTEMMIKLSEKYKIAIPKGKDFFDQAQKFSDSLEKNTSSWQKTWNSRIELFGKKLNDYWLIQNSIIKNEQKTNDLIKEREYMMNALGITIDEPANTTTTTTTTTDDAKSFSPNQGDKAQKDADKAKKDLEKFLQDMNKLRQDAKRAHIDVIQEEMDKELEMLEFERTSKNKSINETRDRLIAEAKELKQGKAVIEQIHADSFAQIVANNEEAEKKKAETRKKYAEEAQQEAYKNDIKNLNDSIAAQRLYYSQLYASGQSDKASYDANIESLDRQSKQQLLDIAQKYGIDIVKVQQDIADDEIKVLQDKIERAKRLQERQAEFAVQMAQFNYDNNGGSYSDVFKAKFEQLNISLMNELDAVKLTEEEKLQIYRDYNLKKLELDAEYKAAKSQMEMEERQEISEKANFYLDSFGQAFSNILSFRQDQISSELQAVQSQIAQESNETERAYKNRLISDTEYTNAKERNRKKLEKAEKDARRKQAIADKVQALFNIGLSTAQGIMQLWVNPGFPAAIPMAITVGALGALQAGLVAARPIPQYYMGGFTQKVVGAQDGKSYSASLLPGFENGYLNNPSLVLAGEQGPEYFVNSTMLQKPAVAHVVDGIEAMSRGRLTYPDFVRMLALPAFNQKYTGGYTEPTSTGSSKQDTYYDMTTYFSALKKLNDLLERGIEARAYIPDRTIVDLKDRNDYLETIKNEAS